MGGIHFRHLTSMQTSAALKQLSGLVVYNHWRENIDGLLKHLSYRELSVRSTLQHI